MDFPDLMKINATINTDISNVTFTVKLLSNTTIEGWIYKTYFVADYMKLLPKMEEDPVTNLLYQLLDISEIDGNYFDGIAHGWIIESVIPK